MSGKYLRRYSELTALIYLLSRQAITLLDPQSWDDSNDSHYLSLYKEKRSLKSVLALCFTETDERYHYWRVFASGASGVCIQFTRPDLLKAARKQVGMEMRAVKYVRLVDIRQMKLESEELPFLKRYAFEHEHEFRMIYESAKRKVPKLDINIPLSCIDKITLSPWIHQDVVPYVEQRILSIDGCGDLRIVRSTLIDNQEWKSLGEAAT